MSAAEAPQKLYRLYLDESGDHTKASEAAPEKRYLALSGVVLSSKAEGELHARWYALKRKHLAWHVDDPEPPLHRTDIMKADRAFSPLRDRARRDEFDTELLGIIKETRYRAICVVLDKLTHGEKEYRALKHPYHYCLVAMLERYCGWLKYIDGRGDVMAEARGAVEDRLLKEEYARIYASGSSYMGKADCQAVLTSKELKLRSKKANIAGLQLADLLANPMRADVLRRAGSLKEDEKPFEARVLPLVRYNKREDTGKITGYGRILLD